LIDVKPDFFVEAALHGIPPAE